MHYHDCVGYLEPAEDIINSSGISPDRFINYSADKFIDYLKGEE